MSVFLSKLLPVFVYPVGTVAAAIFRQHGLTSGLLVTSGAHMASLVDELAAPLPSGRPRRELITFVADRSGHDFRYAMDISKIEAELG